MVKEISYKNFPYLPDIASYQVFGKWSPAVYKEAKGYGIRILKSQTVRFDGSTNTSWDYFKLDENGLIVESPRGLSKQFTRKVRITDMETFVESYKEKRINE